MPMNGQLQFIPFTSPDDNGWAEAMEIYRQSFPYKEQRSEAEHIRALENPDFHADGIWQDGVFIGILYYWNAGPCDYIEHLAISPRLRGQNMGSAALAAFCPGRRVVLEIDPPVDEISIRRRGFYQRMGFVENAHRYIHPSFCRPFEEHRLVLMSYPTPLSDDEARHFADYVRETVLRYTEHDHTPDNPRIP